MENGEVVLIITSFHSSRSVHILLDFNGEVSEWLKVPLSKSGRVNSPRGFDSHPLRLESPEGIPLGRVYRKVSRVQIPPLPPKSNFYSIVIHRTKVGVLFF